MVRLRYPSHHRRRLHGGDRGDRHHGQKVVGAMPPSRPHRNFLMSIFLNSKMSQFLHVDVWFNPLQTLCVLVYVPLVAFSNFGWSILLCLLFTLVFPKFNFFVSFGDTRAFLEDSVSLQLSFFGCIISKKWTSILKRE